MKRCIPPRDPARLKGGDAEVLAVSGLDVVANSDGNVIEFRLDTNPPPGMALVHLLSPPAAQQLSKSLRNAVKDYLRSVPEEPA